MIVVDTETTGLNPKIHSAIGIGAYSFEDHSLFAVSFRGYTGYAVDAAATAVNGMTKKEIENEKTSFEDGIIKFYNHLCTKKSRVLAGHNINFDQAFLNDSFKKCDIDFSFKYTVDLHSIVYGLMFAENHGQTQHTLLSSDKIFAFVGLPPEPKPHKAITGTMMEAEAFNRLLLHKPLFKEFRGYKMPERLLKSTRRLL